jgi:hypothetical protein
MQYVVETFLDPGEPSNALLRVRPCAGQGLPTTLRVQCSRSMRVSFREGQKFLVNTRWFRREGSPDWLFCYYRDKCEAISDEQAAAFIQSISERKHRRQQGWTHSEQLVRLPWLPWLPSLPSLPVQGRADVLRSLTESGTERSDSSKRSQDFQSCSFPPNT